MKYFIPLLILFISCSQKSPEIQPNENLNNAIQLKTADSLAFLTFKAEHASWFKTFDSLKNLNQITTERQKIHDSLVHEGVKLAMKLVRDQMKLNDLQKEAR